MRYQLNPDPDVVRWWDDAGNSGFIRSAVEGAWAAYQAWLDEGNVPEPYETAPTLSVEDARARASALLNLTMDAVLQPIVSTYSQGEAASWPVQLFEAAQWLADPNAPTPLIDPICVDVDKAQMCHAIVAKGAAYGRLCGEVIAWRRACSAWIETCSSVADLMAWQPNYPEVPDASY